MADMINSIPVYKPQGSVRPAQQQIAPSMAIVSNPFPQVQTYSYIPARPLSPSRTTPKGARPHAERGRLVKENIFQSMGSTVKSYGDYFKYFYKAAFKGEGTDYSVGKINDLAIRTGSLGIAATLAASKFFPAARGMEFVGLGTWFASMAIWPQLMGAPIKAKTGVDINQKYIDSYGRRKFVYEDNLYRPMDLYRHVDLNGKPLSQEEYYKKYDKDYAYLDAVGDKLGIPRDIKNRHEAIMNKMGQVAVQGKTLWMLTAGVMTPVISSIVADAVQTPLKDGLEAHRYKKAEAEINKMDEILYKLLDRQNGYNSPNKEKNIDVVMSELGIKIPENVQKEFDSLLLKDCELSKVEFERLKAHADGSLNGTRFQNMLKDAISAASSNGEKVTIPREKMSSMLGAIYSEDTKNVSHSVKEELDYLLSRSKKLDKKEFDRLQKFIENRFFGTGVKNSLDNVVKYDVKYTEPYITLCDSLHEGLAKSTANAVKEAVSKMQKAFADTLPEAVKNYQGISRDEYLSIIKNSKNDGAKEMNTLARNSFENMAKRIAIQKFQQMGIDSDAVDMISSEMDKHIKKFIEEQRHFIIPHEKLAQLFKFAETNHQLIQKIEKFESASIMNIAESITANNWNKVPKGYLKALNLSKAELAQIAALDSTSASKVLMKKFEQIAADPKEYEKVIKKMTLLAQDAITKEEKAIIKIIGTNETPGVLSKLKDLMETVGGANFGDRMSQPVESLYRTALQEVQNKLRNTTDSLVRPMKALDSFRYLDVELKKYLGQNADEFKKYVYSKKADGSAMFPDYHMFEGMEYEDALKSMKAFIKDVILDKNDINNWTTKLEHNVPGAKRGLKYSLSMLKGVANIVNGQFNEETERIIQEAFVKITEEAAAKDKEVNKARVAQCSKGEDFLVKCSANNEIMRARFLKLKNELTLAYSEGKRNFMTEAFPLDMFTGKLFDGNKKDLRVLETLIDEVKTEISIDDLDKLKKILQDLKNGIKPDKNYRNYIYDMVKSSLHFSTNNFAVANMSGKNITEFMKNAAEEVRSRNKWTKTAYGLLAGTTALTAIAISMIGKKNYFNKDIYERKDAPQGVVR